MKLHWSPRSPYVRKTMIAAHVLGVADRIERVRSVAVMTRPNPAIMADNPLNKIPTLVLEDGTVLVDSRVICEYLDALSSGPHIFPAPGPARWQALSWAARADGLLDLLILWRNEREKPSETRTAAWIDAFREKAGATLDRFEQELAAIESQPFGIAHIGLGCALGYLDFRFADLGWREGRPQLARWYRGFEEHPAAIATEIIDD
ncbi:glutathione S-transferase family protein [Sphingomonas soli]|uniref:glutathione S-transferase family protein n=1 Tax=Sphingomonas soli TaxID=266127 RepID=UPI00082A3961|nr:glutathione S-transferase [Sphingomonas soli]